MDGEVKLTSEFLARATLVFFLAQLAVTLRHASTQTYNHDFHCTLHTLSYLNLVLLYIAHVGQMRAGKSRTEVPLNLCSHSTLFILDNPVCSCYSHLE